MKSFAVYILLFALIGGALCARFRREEAAESPESPESAESPESPESPESNPAGLDIALAFLKADPGANPAVIDKLEAIQAQNKAAQDAAAAAKPADAGPPEA